MSLSSRQGAAGRDRRRYHDASGYLADELPDELRSFTSSAR